MKISRAKIIWAFVILAVVGGIVFFVTRKPTTTYETEKIARGTVVEEVSVTGSLAPVKKIDLQPEVSGRVVKLNVDSGSLVKTGDVLVVLDGSDVQSQIVSQRAAVDATKAHLAELSAGATAQELAVAQTALDTATSRRDSAIAAKADANTSVANAQAAFANSSSQGETLSANKLQSLSLAYDKAVVDAKDAIDRLTGPMFTSDSLLTFSTYSSMAETNAKSSRLDAEAKKDLLATTVATAKVAGTVGAALGAYAGISADLAGIKAHLEDDQVVLTYANGLSSATLAQYQQNVSTALSTVTATIQLVDSSKSDLELQSKMNETSLTAAQTQLSNAQAQLTSATFAVDTAEKSLSQAKADLTLKQAGNRPEVIAAQRAQVEVAQAALSGLYTALAKRSLLSPIDGIVTDVPIQVGETVGPSTLAVSLQTKGNFQITANISEIDIGKVTVGDPVNITLDAFPKTETWTGKVIKIDPAEKVIEGVIFYETTVVFDNEDPRLRSGMTANLSIQTNKKDNVLRVPLRALNDTGTKTTVRILVNGVPQEVEVKIGLENNTHAEAISGLSEGDVVILSTTTK